MSLLSPLLARALEPVRTLVPTLGATLGLVLGPLAVVLASPAPPGAAADAAAAADPAFEQPAVGSCWSYTMKQRAKDSDPSAPVSCAGPHTALTVAVLTLRKGVSIRDGDAAFAASSRACARATNATLGGTKRSRALTAYSGTAFFPTRSQIRQGARWVRCDVVLVGGNRLELLPTPLVTDPPTDAIARCIKRSGLVTVCARPHWARGTEVVTLSGGYPSPAAARRIGTRRCDAAGGRDAYIFPTALSWRAGFRHVTCYRITGR